SPGPGRAFPVATSIEHNGGPVAKLRVVRRRLARPKLPEPRVIGLGRANGILRTLTAPVRPRGVEAQAPPLQAQATGAGLGWERLRVTDLRLLRLRLKADSVQRRVARGDLADARAWPR